MQVQQRIGETMQFLNLVPHEYDAIHMRVEHPAFLDHNNSTFDRSDETVDVFDSYPERCLREAAVSLQCARWIAEQQCEPRQQQNESLSICNHSNMTIYFYSDSSHLVNAITSPFAASIGIYDIVWKNNPPMNVVGRANSSNLHIAAKEESLISSHFDSFAGTFVDLYIAAQARCVTLGLGRFALLAAKISGTSCFTRSMDPSLRLMNYWGMKDGYKDIPKCPYIDQPLDD